MKHKWYIIVLSICLLHTACEEFVDVDLPDNKISSETVFGSDETANAAVMGIYNELYNLDGFSNGGFRSVTLLGDLSADNLRTITLNQEMSEFQESEIISDNAYNQTLWSSAYNIIYMCNAVLDGLDTYSGVSNKTRDRLMGEVQFVRAFAYFYLVNLYGEVPLVQSSDYRQNAMAPRSSIEDIYSAMTTDLESSIHVLGDSYGEGERWRANRFTAQALLARVHLYLENWEKAENHSTEIIGSTENFTLLDHLDDIFLANSKEAIWQITPAGRSLSFVTNEGRILILTSPPPNSQKPVALTTDLMGSFADEDLRMEHWIGKLDTEDGVYHYPFKYKVNSANVITEYSMVLRLAEQYLIRAEARAHQDNLPGAIADLDKIRTRAHLVPLSIIDPGINRAALLDSIHLERRRELFTEWGHRWLDLKRTGSVSKVLGIKKPLWQDTDVLYPIPETEIDKNPSLTQNNGY
ncbi:RagB/SusD family nutrient uptake outer membrane protein [Arenibacter sp. ARW7G5Y1]|uniref:RagB/SusD family nutrient uptake outer membrane protein n=1 Tax=Arenibacter sp. ARW7G5Y1 TaxID=2135619 RepID=UPI000D76815A|nr:RagB/SusD family nutrient uptake outer membrane protein [Arenibacter sp. ARW7G5Y1]PXX29946.1 SusD-like starch-binding protein associating with outer membrane [Arenibacter sp. ARW7G5Y1]